LLIRMAEVWDALAAHTSRIAARRAAAEAMPDVPLAPPAGEPAPPGDSPDLVPSDADLIRKEEYNA
jgi:hypothetical protein